MEKFFKKVPFHFGLIAFYPFLGLYIHNALQMPAYAGIKALIFSGLVLVLFFLINLALLRRMTPAALLTCVGLALFYSYGHILDFIEKSLPLFAHHSFLIAAFGLIFLAFLVFLWRSHSSFDNINLIVNSMALLLILLMAGETLVMYLNGQWFIEAKIPVKNAVEITPTNVSANRPDVYYFLLDSYARQDKLLSVEQYDNSPFIEQLRQRGFVIPACTQSNYDNTLESVSSSLNMDYLDQLGVDTTLDGDAEMVLTTNLIQNNAVRKHFKDMGYLTYAFATKAPFVNLSDSDYYYDVNAQAAYLNRIETLNFFELFLKTTAVRFVWQTELHNTLEKMPLRMIQWIEPQSDIFSSGRYHEYLQNEYSLNKLMEIPGQAGSKFVYAHLMVTHSSYVHNWNGSFMINTDESTAAYVTQVNYLNQRLLKIIDKILAESEVPPIIILQGDHNNENAVPIKVQILNAYYLPPQDGRVVTVSDEISPVNTFRLIFNQYFNGNYPFLENRSYYRDPDGVLLPVAPSCVEQ